jgi:hypothetical protein
MPQKPVVKGKKIDKKAAANRHGKTPTTRKGKLLGQACSPRAECGPASWIVLHGVAAGALPGRAQLLVRGSFICLCAFSALQHIQLLHTDVSLQTSKPGFMQACFMSLKSVACRQDGQTTQKSQAAGTVHDRQGGQPLSVEHGQLHAITYCLSVAFIPACCWIDVCTVVAKQSGHQVLHIAYILC